MNRINSYSRYFLLCGFCLVTAFSDTQAGSITGKVLRKAGAENQTKTIQRYKNRGKMEEVEKTDCACNPGLYSVISLRGENLPPVQPEPQALSMAQKNKTFEPSVLAISVGSEVTFPNLDPFFHNVFSYSKPKKFDLGRYPEGNTKTVVFDKPGVVSVFCEIHYSMRAYIHVFDTPYYAVSDNEGRFELEHIAPGRYTLTVWQENLPEITREITIGNESIYLEFP